MNTEPVAVLAEQNGGVPAEAWTAPFCSERGAADRAEPGAQSRVWGVDFEDRPDHPFVRQAAVSIHTTTKLIRPVPVRPRGILSDDKQTQTNL